MTHAQYFGTMNYVSEIIAFVQSSVDHTLLFKQEH